MSPFADKIAWDAIDVRAQCNGAASIHLSTAEQHLAAIGDDDSLPAQQRIEWAMSALGLARIALRGEAHA